MGAGGVKDGCMLVGRSASLLDATCAATRLDSPERDCGFLTMPLFLSLTGSPSKG